MGDEFLDRYLHFVDALALTLGRNSEVVLHDFRKPHSSIVRIANGHVTGREIGDPATDLILSHISRGKDVDYIFGYKTKSPKGADLKSTTIFIRNGRRKIIGALCINMDLTPYQQSLTLLDEICSIPATLIFNQNDVPSEMFESDIENLFAQMLDQCISEIGKPIVHMDKDDKIQLIRKLKFKGFFLIKGAAKKVSEEVHVALPTIYKYLEEAGE